MTPSGRALWLAIGVAGGYCLALLQHQYFSGGAIESPPANVAAQAGTPAANRQRGPASAAILVSVENPATGEFVRTPGLIIGAERHVLMALAPIRNAQSAFLEFPGASRQPAGEVVAVDFDLGLAVLTTPLNGGAKFESSRDSGSLYLGREFSWQSPQSPGNGFVDSSAQQTPGGHYVYALRLAGQTPTPPTALLGEQSSQLIGVLLPARNGAADQYQAIDADTLRELLDSIGDFEPMPLPVFANFYANGTDAGRIEQLTDRVSARDWAGALQLAEFFEAGAPPDSATQILLEKAYQGRTTQLLAGGDIDAAMKTLDAARRHLGNAAARMALRAAAFKALNQDDEALVWYAKALQAEPSLEASLRPALRDYALSLTHRPSNSVARSIALLQRVISSDPNFAAYHARLGQLLFQNGRYNDADAAFARALVLDPSLAGELEALQASARQKRNLPHSAEAPIDTRGNAIFVDVILNGRTAPFRFLLDTGASYTAISVETALRLGIDNTFFGAPVTALETANGRIYATVTQLGSVAVGQATVNDVDVVILDTMSGADGLLGLSFLDHFNVDINHTVGKISLVRR